MPSNLASRHNTRRHTNIQGRDNRVDRGQGSRLGSLRNMTRDRSSLEKSCDSLRSLLPRTTLKAEEAAESLASIWFFFHSHLLFVWFLILLFASVFVFLPEGRF